MQKCFNFQVYYKSQVKVLSLLQRNIRILEFPLTIHKFASPGPETEAIRGEVFELDTLALARLGRQEQARYLAELASAGVKRAAGVGRKIRRTLGEFLTARVAHSLKGN